MTDALADDLARDPEALDYASQRLTPPRFLDRPMRLACLACGGVGSVAIGMQFAAAVVDDKKGVTTTLGNVLSVAPSIRDGMPFEAWLYLVPTLAACGMMLLMPLLLTIGVWPAAFAGRRGRVLVRASALLLALAAIGNCIGWFDRVFTRPPSFVSTRTLEAAAVGSAAIALHASFAVLIVAATLSTTHLRTPRRLAIALCFIALAFGSIASPGGTLMLCMPPRASEPAVVDHWPGRLAALVMATDYGDSLWSMWPTRLIGIAAVISATAAFVRPRDRVVLWALTAIPLVAIACTAFAAEAFDATGFLESPSHHQTWRIVLATIGNELGDSVQPTLLLAFILVAISHAWFDQTSASSR